MKAGIIQPKLIGDITNPPSYNLFKSQIISVSVYQIRMGKGRQYLTSQEHMMVSDSWNILSVFPQHALCLYNFKNSDKTEKLSCGATIG